MLKEGIKSRAGEIEKDTDYIKWLFELDKKSGAVAGGKGANLAEMFNSKFPVPPAFIVTAQAYEYFIKSTGLYNKIHDSLKKINIESTKELQEKSKEIREMIKRAELPDDLKKEILESYELLGSENLKGIQGNALDILKSAKEDVFVAIRSSATTEDLADASFAGQQETFLNIKGKSEVLEKVKACFASLFTARAIYYREKKGFEHEKSLLAVVVQKMVDSDKSGVMFSKDPVNKSDNVVIEAVFGLGEGIVSGQIKPDHYLVSRALEILNEQISEKKIAIVRRSSGENETVKLTEAKSKSEVLTRAQVNELANYAIRLEEHYKKPQDIEFAIESGKIYIVQTRPITTVQSEGEHKELSGKILLQGFGASPGVSSGPVRIIKTMNDLDKIKKGDVLVTEMTNPDMVVDMQKSSAIITDEGGLTSHASIVSREMGIPCVVGTDKATQILQDGQIVTVDGRAGKVYEGKILLKGAEEKLEIKPIVETKTKIKVILDLPDFAERAAKTQSKYVGLLRLEGIIAESGKHPLMFLAEGRLQNYIEILERGIERIAKHFQSVWIRSSDIRSDEFKNLKGAPQETELNPMLGFHGIRFSLRNPDILESEIFAIKKVAEKFPNKEFGVMFPQIISVKELKEAKKIFNKFKTKNMKVGAMIETPAACQIILELCDEGIDFISFGTNDLTQFTLAIDRGNENIQDLYNEMHPAVLSQIKQVIHVCKEKGVETSLCGQAGSRKEMAKFLFNCGIDSISVNADAAQEVSEFIKLLEEKQGKNRDIEEKQEIKEITPEPEKLVKQFTHEIEEEKKPESKQTMEVEEKPEEQKQEESKESGNQDKPEEFPDMELGFDIFTGGAVGQIDDTSHVEEKIDERVEEVEQEKKEAHEEHIKNEEEIQTESSVEEVEKVDESDSNDEEVKDVIDEIQGKKDPEDIDIQEPKQIEDSLDEDDSILDVF